MPRFQKPLTTEEARAAGTLEGELARLEQPRRKGMSAGAQLGGIQQAQKERDRAEAMAQAVQAQNQKLQARVAQLEAALRAAGLPIPE